MRLFVSCISRLPIALVLLVLLTALRWSSALHAAEQRVADPEDLPRFPPVAARDALNTFQLRKGFPLELVAAEPLVTDPIALAFDADGRLFVIEMNDYPDRKQHRGQINRLEDTDGDGRFDKSTVFARGLRWPSAVTVRQPPGIEVVVARKQIARMQASKLSLMPEGLEEGLSSQDLADLLDFLFADIR